MDFIPAPGCVLIKPLRDESVIASVDKNYNRMGEVIGLADYTSVSWVGITKEGSVEVGDIICFDEYAYRRFNHEGKEYCVVNVSESGSLWGIIKNHARTTEKSVQEEGLSAPVSTVPKP